MNCEIQVYETSKMDTIAQKMQDAKISDFSISPSASGIYYFLCYIPGTIFRLFDYRFIYDLMMQ